MSSKLYDIIIVGAGVVGCALARRFTLDGAKVLIIEKSSDVLDGASKGNSAILHTGFDAPPGSLEQACIAAGYAEYLDIAENLSLPILQSGAMVLAWSDEQMAQLPALIEKAHKNGVTDVRMLEACEISRREPHLSPNVLGGFEIPGEYLIDPWSSPHAYILQALENGAELWRETELTKGEFDGATWRLDTTSGSFRSRFVINAAGLFGDIVDERLLGKTDFKVTPRKGQFLVFDKAASDLVSAIVLPVPTAITKGVVICRTIFGNVLVGPTAEDQESRTDGSTRRATLNMLRDKGIEMLPDLGKCEVTAAYAGLRPATEFSDYQIRHHEDASCITVGGIRSTGLSAALGIAQHVSRLVRDLGFHFDPLPDPASPLADRLSNYHPRDWQDDGGGDIVCHCELVTRREIANVLDSRMPPESLAGLKRRTRAMMGRCQGFYCAAELTEITRGRLKRPMGIEHE